MSDKPLSSGERIPEPDGLEELLGPVHDPHMKRVLDRAREFNAEIKAGDVSRFEAIKMRAELNRLWSYYTHMSVTITGRGEVVFPALPRPQDAVLPGVDAISQGFDILEDEQATEVGKSLHLMFSVNRELLDGNELGADGKPLYDEQVTIRAGIDDVLVEPRIPHPEHAKQWLRFVAPDQIAEIETRIVEAHGDEVAAMRALQGLRFDQFPMIEDAFTRECMEVYLNTLIRIDQSSAYVGTIRGLMYRTTPEYTVKTPELKTQAMYGFMSRLQIVDSSVEQAEEPWVVAAAIAALTRNMDDNSDFLLVPIKSLHDLVSLRRRYAPGL